MLSKRIVGSLIVQDGTLVQSRGFSSYLPIGSPEIAAEFLDRWGVDEIMMLDIGERRRSHVPDLALVSALSKKIRVPLTVGGGIDNVETMRALIRGGADKCALNQVAVENPAIITDAARIFGNQCVVVSIDVRRSEKGYEVYTDSGTRATGKDPMTFAKECVSRGAGEILIRRIERDGSKKGYDTALVRLIADAVDIPLIAAGGCGTAEHVRRVFEEGHADAAAVGNMLHFSEHSVNVIKAQLLPHVDVRLDMYATYEQFTFDGSGRPAKRPDEYLEKLRFEYYPEETI